MIDPIEALTNRELYTSEKEDIFFTLLDKEEIYIHVEDKNKFSTYELLFEELYPELRIKVFANYSGKAELLREYYEKKEINKLVDKEYYLIDRDYENFNKDKKYNSLLKHSFLEISNEFPRIIVLKKTNFESYFLDKDSFKRALKVDAGYSNEELEKFLEVYNKVMRRMEKLSKFYLINTYFEKNLRKNPTGDIELSTFNYNSAFKEQVLNLKEEIEREFQKITKSFIKNLNFNPEIDIDGKQTHRFLAYACKHFSKNTKNIMNDRILRSQISNLTPFQKAELKKDIPLKK